MYCFMTMTLMTVATVTVATELVAGLIWRFNCGVNGALGPKRLRVSLGVASLIEE